MPQQLKSKSEKPFFKTYQILIPVILGIGVIIWLFFREFDIASLKEIRFDSRSIIFILLACCLMICRDIGMTTRFRLMTNKELSWKQAFNVNILREFAFAIMPAAIGAGPSVIILLNKEGINAGRSTAISMINLFLDNLFFVCICPVIFMFVPLSELFNNTSAISSTIGIIFWTVYPLLCLWTTTLFVGLFIRPDLIDRFLRFVFRLRILRRWEQYIEEFCENLMNASHEIKKRPFTFWFKIFIVTSCTWTARFFVANALFMAFTHIDDQMVIFGRQVIIWLAMVVSPTPGGSGLNEIAFKEFYNDLMLGSGTILIIVAIWRIISYYVYLLLGVIIFPRWARKSFSRKNKTTEHDMPVLLPKENN